jgi:hypothetical protein
VQMFKDPCRCSKIRADVQRSVQMFKDPRRTGKGDGHRSSRGNTEGAVITNALMVQSLFLRPDRFLTDSRFLTFIKQGAKLAAFPMDIDAERNHYARYCRSGDVFRRGIWQYVSIAAGTALFASR